MQWVTSNGTYYSLIVENTFLDKRSPGTGIQKNVHCITNTKQDIHKLESLVDINKLLAEK